MYKNWCHLSEGHAGCHTSRGVKQQPNNFQLRNPFSLSFEQLGSLKNINTWSWTVSKAMNWLWAEVDKVKTSIFYAVFFHWQLQVVAVEKQMLQESSRSDWMSLRHTENWIGHQKTSQNPFSWPCCSVSMLFSLVFISHLNLISTHSLIRARFSSSRLGPTRISSICRSVSVGCEWQLFRLGHD